MTALAFEVRPGAYHDSIVLMQLQSALLDQPRVIDCGVVMATAANLQLLEANRLLPEPPESLPEIEGDDLLVIVKAETRDAAEAAVQRIDTVLGERRKAAASSGYRPRSLATALRQLPDARWALISVAGRYADRVSHEALTAGLNVFLYSDNVSKQAEAELKQYAADRGLMLMGPDCGTAIVGGVGLGFANRVRRGNIGLIGASGTGLQSVSCRIHELGAGISQALGTGGRDLQEEIGAITARQAIDVLSRDSTTEVLVLISKPPSARVASQLLAAASACGKPVVVCFLGFASPAARQGHLHFARGLDEAAEIAVALHQPTSEAPSVQHSEAIAPPGKPAIRQAATRQYLRGLFSGGTLAQETLLGLRTFLSPLSSNLTADGVEPLADPSHSVGHTLVDLGADELTVGRLHPMMDPSHAQRRIQQETEDGEVAILLLDLVLGDVAHMDPATQLESALRSAIKAGIEVLVLVVGSDDDPQDLNAQVECLEAIGAQVFRRISRVTEYIADRLIATATATATHPVDLVDLTPPLRAINIGVEAFYDSLQAQGAEAVQVDWRPPAGGNRRLAAILENMK